MTKPRAPLSLGAALARIAGQVPGDWAAMGEEVGRHARTVRKWGDDDAEEDIAIGAALKLDIMFQRHGGQGFPIYEAFGQLLDCAVAHSFTDRFEILRRARDFAKEAGEANTAILSVGLPGSTEQDRLQAVKETIDAIRAANVMLPLLESWVADPDLHNRGPPAAAD